MTNEEAKQLIDRHLEGWLEGNDNPTPLRDRIAAMIAEAEAGRDKLWQDGNAVLRQERDTALTKLASMTEARDHAIAAAHIIHENKL